MAAMIIAYSISYHRSTVPNPGLNLSLEFSGKLQLSFYRPLPGHLSVDDGELCWSNSYHF
jgi:hypothetical protein